MKDTAGHLQTPSMIESYEKKKCVPVDALVTISVIQRVPDQDTNEPGKLKKAHSHPKWSFFFRVSSHNYKIMAKNEVLTVRDSSKYDPNKRLLKQ